MLSLTRVTRVIRVTRVTRVTRVITRPKLKHQNQVIVQSFDKMVRVLRVIESTGERGASALNTTHCLVLSGLLRL